MVESKNFLENVITFSPLLGLYESLLLAPPSSEIKSVPYNASYKLPQRALVALSANLAFITGTTNCGPAIVLISGSTLEVEIVKSP